jgi:pantoate--beta-alanine ligase
MKIIRNIKNLQESIVNIPNLGFVPTMGGLHKGHLKLIKKSINRSQKTLVSIYVNPKQFNQKKDFLKYPRNTTKDLQILKRQKVDFVFLPRTEEIYKSKIRKNIKIHRKKNVLCGKFRKGHFEGVIDVIDRFLSLINPKYIFLGEKDFQQLFLIKNYVKNKFKVKVVSCKTVRDKNYVALSSRNFLLSKKNLTTAGKIAKKLKSFKNRLKNNQNFKKNINDIKNKLIEKYNIKLEYLELRNEKDLSIFKKNNKFRLFVAYYINKVRIIDNF